MEGGNTTMNNSPRSRSASGQQWPRHVVCLSVRGVGEAFLLPKHNNPPMVGFAMTKTALRERYQRYAGKHPAPMSFKAWLFFREQGLLGARLSTTNHSAAGKTGMAKRWGKG